MKHGCIDCLNDGAPFLDALVALLVMAPVIIALAYLGYRIMLRLWNRK